MHLKQEMIKESTLRNFPRKGTATENAAKDKPKASVLYKTHDNTTQNKNKI